MPVYREGKDQWRVKVWIKGRVRNRRVRGSKADAEAVEARWRIELAAARPASTAPTFLTFLLDAYLPHAELRLKPSWLRNQRYTLATLGAALGLLPLTDVTGAVLEAYAQRRAQAGLGATSLNNEMRIARRVLAYAVELGHLHAVPRWTVLPERVGRGAHAWTHDQVRALMDACVATAPKHAPGVLPLVVYLVNTGCRRGEALALRWEHVDLERGLIQIWPSDEWQPKSGRPREVPIADALLPWLQLPRTSPYVFPTRTCGPRLSWPAKQFDDARKAAGLEGGPHTLRHTFASHFLARVPDLTLLAEILGHSDAAVTRLYKHLLPDHLARARNAVQMAATPAAAEALATARWRAERKTFPETFPGGFSGGAAEASSPSERATGFEPATSSLGSTGDRRNILKLLARTK